MPTQSSLLPILVASLAILILTIMDGFIKALSPHYPTLVIVALRFVFGGVVALAVYVAMGAPRPSAETLRMAALRGVFIVLSAAFFFAALGMLPLVEVIALAFVTPIIIAVMGRIFLKEAIGSGVVVAILLGIAGIAVMLFEPLTGALAERQNLLGVAMVMIANLTYSASLIILRARATQDPLPTLVLLQNWVPALFVAPVAGAVWVTPSLDHVWMFAVIGVLGATGHILLTWAFARAPAARLGVIEYTAFVWAAVIGYVWFAEVPSVASIVGAVLIVAGALVVARR